MKFDGKGVIYKIINLTNGKFYVGSTIKPKDRFRTHRRKLRKGTHHCVHLQNAWNQCGEDNFVFRVVEVVDAPSELHVFEQRWLDEHHGTPQCYNHAKYTDSSNRGVVRPESHRRRLSKALLRHYEANPHPMVGFKHSEESIALMRQNRAGIPVSEEKKEKLRQANLGKRASAETRAKLSAMRKGRPKSPEHIAKYNKAVIEVTSGEIFASLKEVKERFGMSPGLLNRILKADRPVAKGKHAGKHFRYVPRE